MASSVQEFRERARKTVTLPSGLIVEIRKVWLIDFFDVGELFNILPTAESEDKEKPDPTRALKLKAQEDKYLTRAIIMGAVDPVFSEDDTSDAAVWIKDLIYEDFIYLGNEILAWSGTKKEVAADADTFRPDAIGQNGERPGGEVREASGGDTKDGAGGVLSQSSSDLPGDREEEKKA